MMNNYCREELIQIIQCFACAYHDNNSEWAAELGDKYYVIAFEAEEE